MAVTEVVAHTSRGDVEAALPGVVSGRRKGVDPHSQLTFLHLDHQFFTGVQGGGAVVAGCELGAHYDEPILLPVDGHDALAASCRCRDTILAWVGSAQGTAIRAHRDKCVGHGNGLGLKRSGLVGRSNEPEHSEGGDNHEAGKSPDVAVETHRILFSDGTYYCCLSEATLIT